MPETRQVMVYSFAELSEKAKEKAREHFRYVDVECGHYAECVTDELREKLGNVGIDVAHEKHPFVYWSADRDRYAYLEKPIVDSSKMLTAIIGNSQNGKPDFDDFSVSISTNYRGRGGGSAKNEVEVTYEGLEEEECSDELCEKFREEIQQFLDDALHDFLKAVEAEYENATSDEYIEEMINCNEYAFRENGEVFR